MSHTAMNPGETFMDDEQLKLLRVEAESYKKAQRLYSEAAGVLWNAQLDFAIASRRADWIDRVLGGNPVGIFDNCSCTQGSW
jgi:hypothetical protein